ncbi:DUF680 domain-containing protein [Mesorhizobium sp. WSM3862]|uniref:DUF680 domain-containing protein n=1 Tax=Mesorhizobium sp. WSM3862 TaxID=632858 RepID=UPI000BAEC23F|nr:DUF680 domain-containing protein [Mesorhizobium sp. WSM3862]PBB96846.1 hypothetical protein CK224_21115 [Mesorhizobium sp. WSM3862]
MTRASLATAALLVSGSAAFAGSDHYGSDNVYRPTAPVSTNIDHNFTASIDHHKRHVSLGSPFDPEPGQGIWGH